MKQQLQEPIYSQLQKIEKEIKSIKLILVSRTLFKIPTQCISLGGILKGLKVDEKDFELAEKSLFKYSA